MKNVLTSRAPEGAPQPRRVVDGLLLVLRLTVSGSLLAYLIIRADPAAIWATWRAANVWLILLAVVFQLLCIVFSVLKWDILLRAHEQRLPFRWLLRAYLVGLFANNFLPTSVGGDAVRIVQLGRRIGNYAQASASVFMERLTGFLGLSLLACVALVATSTDLLGARLVNQPALTALAFGFTLVSIAAVIGSFAAPWLLGHFRTFLPRSIHQPLQSVADALGIYATDRVAMLLAMALSILVHLLWIAMHAICGLALAIAAPILIYTLIVPLTDIVGLAPIFLNNLGAREMVFALYLGQLGLSEGSALALAFTAFSVRLAVSALGGLLLLFGERSQDVGGSRQDLL